MNSPRDFKRLAAYAGATVGVLALMCGLVWDFALNPEPVTPVLALGIGSVLFIALRPKLVWFTLLAAVAVFLRPNISSASFNVLAVVTLFAIGFLVLASVRFRSDLLAPGIRGTGMVPVWLGLAYVVVLFQAGNSGANVSPIATGAVIDVAAVVAVLMMLANQRYWRLAARLFVGLTLAFCLSYVITIGVWAFAGTGSGVIGAIPGAYKEHSVNVVFPFTPTFGTLQVFGSTVPRFTGFAREPGWMAMYAGTAFLLFPYTGWTSKLLRSVLILGLLGTISTGGFGVFAVTIALQILLSAKGKSQALQRLLGLFLLGAGTYAALFAPVLGLASKSDLNAASLDERQLATNAGIRALLTDPFSGGLAEGNIPNINLIAAVAANGIIYVAAISLAILCVFAGHKNKSALVPPIVGIFGTLLTAQPANGSSFVFCLAVICAVATHGPMRTAEPRPQAKGRGISKAYDRLGDRLDAACTREASTAGPAAGGRVVG